MNQQKIISKGVKHMGLLKTVDGAALMSQLNTPLWDGHLNRSNQTPLPPVRHPCIMEAHRKM